MFIEIYKRINFWKNVDRIGPGISYTHWGVALMTRERSVDIDDAFDFEIAKSILQGKKEE